MVDLRRHDMRFHPYNWQLKPTTGKSQYGMDFDRWGNRFICMNRVQVQHVMAEESSWGHHPHFHFNKTVENLPEERVDDLLKGYNAGARIYPLTEHQTTADSHAGTFTAACAVTIYESDGLPERYFGHVFSCDPTGNLIHFDYLKPKGPGFIATREDNETEFVASRDPWFRPVFLTTGPDGALYVCDMRRKTIEHPDYLPEEIRKRTDFDGGNDTGRIYRIRGGEPTPLKTVLLGIKTTHFPPLRDFIKVSQNRNRWRRETFHRKIVEGIGNPALKDSILRDVQSILWIPQSESRLLLWSLLFENHRLNEQLEWEIFRNDPWEAKVAWADRILPEASNLLNVSPPSFSKLAENLFPPNKGLFFMNRYPENGETSGKISWRFRLALLAGSLDHPRRAAALAHILVKDCQCEWTRSAILQASNHQAAALLQELFRFPNSTDGLTQRELPLIPVFTGEGSLESVEILSRLAMMEGETSPSLLNKLLRRELSNMIQMVFGSGGEPFGRGREYCAVHRKPEHNAMLFAAMLLGMHESGKLPPSDTTKPWLGWGDPQTAEAWNTVKETLAAYSTDDLIEEEESVLHRFRVLAGLEDWVWKLHEALDLNDPRLLDLVIEASRSTQGHVILSEVFDPIIWTRLSHRARNQFLQTACSDKRHAELIFSALEEEILPAGMLNVSVRNQWNRLLSNEQKQRLEDLLGKHVSLDAAASFERLQPASKMQGAPEEVKNLFLNLCSSCHRLDQEVHPLGPDLYGIRNQAKESILLHIVDPNREIASGFEGVEWTTSDEGFIGLLAFENENQIGLQLPSGIDLTFQRNEGTLRNLNLSLMPEGILDALTHQQVADLLAYLRGE